MFDYVSDSERAVVEKYVEASKKKSELERQMEGKQKTGVKTGMHAINPMSGEAMPIYVADFVLMYGTGSVMGTPAHDERDFQFAKVMKILAPQVIVAKDGDKYEDDVAGVE